MGRIFLLYKEDSKMLDLRKVKKELEPIIERLSLRGGDFRYLREIITLDQERRDIIVHLEQLKAAKNETSKKIGLYKREGKDVRPILESIESDKEKISSLDQRLKSIDSTIDEMLLNTPNIPHQEIPVGKDESENIVIKKVGDLPTFDFEPKPHYEIGVNLGLFDFERATKIASSRFVVYKGLGARLERALISFMMDLHTEKHGYKELLLPYIVNQDSMTATGQLPKFAEDAFKLIDDRHLYLNPTAEVPAINMHRNEIIPLEELPIHYSAFTTAFRQEAGSAGRDTRGIIRLHQFNKVELIKFTTPDDSYKALDAMLADSEAVLKALKLPYQVIELCSGDLGFSMAKTYDIEVYIPSQQGYREIGSISNAEDYQARRGNIKFKRARDAKPEYVHTLNGSGLAVGRTVVAILENYQQKDGTIVVPEVLRPYMNTDKIK